MSEQVGQADAALRRVVAWASWRLLGWIVAVGAGTVELWWDAGAIGAAQAEKARLPAKVAEMQAKRDEWAKAGMLAKLERCGLTARPCERVNEGAGVFQSGSDADCRVIQGY